MLIYEWQSQLHALYGSKDQKTSDEALFMSLVEKTGRLSRSILNNDRSGISYSFAQTLSFLFAICSKKGVSLSEAISTRYGSGFCPYCRSYPCQCVPFRDSHEVHKDEFYRIQPDNKKDLMRPMTLRESQDFFRGLYSIHLYISSYEHCVSEVQNRIIDAYMLLRKDSESFRTALVNILVWLLMTADKLRINIEEAMFDLYTDRKPSESPQKAESLQEHPSDPYSELQHLWETAINSDDALKGKTFEDFAFTFFSNVPAFRVRRNIRTNTAEFDLIIGIEPETRGGLYWERFQPLIFVECKNRRSMTGQEVISKILGKVLVHDSGKTTTLIFVISKSDFTQDAIQQSRYAYLKGFLIVPITDNEVEEVLEQHTDIDQYLRNLVEITCARTRSTMC